MNEFPAAPLDRSTRLTTAVTIVVLLGVMGMTGAAADDATGRLVALVLLPLMPVLAWGYAPAGFVAGHGTLEARRRLFGRQRFAVTGRVHRPDWRVGLGVVVSPADPEGLLAALDEVRS